MKDLAMFIGIFVVGYLLTMGLVYVVLSLFPKRKDPTIKGVMNVSGNSKIENVAIQGIEKHGKMKLANG